MENYKVSGINPSLGVQTQYPTYTQNTNQPQPYNQGVPQQQGYAADGYRPSNYSTGYNQGVGAVAPAMGVGGLANGVGSMANSIGGIFGTIINLIVNILNTIVNLVMKAVDALLGLFGVGKKDKGASTDGVSGGNQPMPLPGNQGMGVSSPMGTAVPPPPPGTNVNQAYSIVNDDLKNVQDPNQGIQIINIHTQKARDYRDKAEQFAVEAEKEARSALYSAEKLKGNPTDPKLLGELQAHKSKAMDLLNASKEYTKAVYDESLYAQAANDILNQKFQGAMSAKGNPLVVEGWKNWIGGTTEKSFIFFSKTIKAAPEVFMKSMNEVNANLGRATQLLSTMAPAGAR